MPGADSRLETPRLGLAENLAQFALLVLVNACVGAMVGMERSILPAIGESFALEAHSALLSFIVVFGLTKAFTNYLAGGWSDVHGRKRVLVAGWLIALPVPFLLMWAPSWTWILVANAFLGVSQGLTWSTTVIMKIDLVGPKSRGLAMGLNEAAGYGAVAIAAWATGWIAADYGLRPEPFYLGVVCAVAGLALSLFAVRETRSHAELETREHATPTVAVDAKRVFWDTTWRDRNLASASQVGLVNNLNDGMAWGLFPVVFALAALPLDAIGVLAAAYPASWGLLQLITGAWSDHIGRKPLIVAGMWLQAVAIGGIALSDGFGGFLTSALALGAGTAMVYPTLLAVVGDVAHPAWRARAVGVYRLWRDLGYAIGALLAGITADLFGLDAALWLVAALTFASGTTAALRMSETRPQTA